jgi:uncharacterized protein YceH (UPF0502 family)
LEVALETETAPVARAVAAYGARTPEDDASQEGRIAQLEAAVAELRQEVAALRGKIDDLFGDG